MKNCKQIATEWGLSERTVNDLCKKNKIDGAIKVGKMWKIPDDAKKPIDGRITSGKYVRHSAGVTRKPLPIGISDYVRAQADYYYVDKTMLIKEFLDQKPLVSLFTRPRRFGKTLNMDMLRVFFEISEENTSKYFEDKAIWQCGEEYRNQQGQYPVVFLTFKDVKFDSWKATLDKIRDLLQEEFGRHQELATSERIAEYEKTYFAKIINGDAYDSNTLYVAIDEKSLDYYLYEKDIFNKSLYKSEKQQLRRIESFFNYLYVKNYFELTKAIIGKLQQYTSEGVRDYLQTINGKKEVIERIDDNEKKKIVSNIFKHSRLGMIYGAAGTGKTKVAEHIAKIFDDKNILLLANTNAAKNNLQDRINNAFCDCYTVHDYIKNKNSNKIYDLVIVDECSTVCNEDILQLFEKCNSEAYLLLGDIHQIEAIKFGNWFNFARYFIEKNSVYELSIPYRAKNNNTLLDMWSYVRHYDENMFERLQANGYISTLDESIFEKTEDEIILCLGYDGLYGVNNINRYMQKVNPSNPVEWGNWVYKVGDKVLFNDNKRFGSVLYNNLKGTIVTIDRKDEEIVFQIQIDKKISDRDIFYTDLKLHDCACEGKSIVEFSVKKRIEKDSDTDYSEQVVPFQIAYAVSIHKAQGLEYKSVKVVITEDVDEQISHNIFYTAITRTTDKLKIYLSKETQKKLATKFVESNVGLKQAQIFAQHAGLKLKNKLSS